MIISYLPPEETSRRLKEPATTSIDDAELITCEANSVCTLCYNLDPEYPAADLLSSRWANDEYDIPDDTKVATIIIKNAKYILDRAQHGCVFCGAIATVLTSLHPKWRKGEAHLTIFLATGLPVVVAWKAGISFTHRVSGEIAESLGLDDLQISATIESSPKKLPRKQMEIARTSFELELYRARVPPEHLVLSGTSFQE